MRPSRTLSNRDLFANRKMNDYMNAVLDCLRGDPAIFRATPWIFGTEKRPLRTRVDGSGADETVTRKWRRHEELEDQLDEPHLQSLDRLHQSRRRMRSLLRGIPSSADGMAANGERARLARSHAKAYWSDPLEWNRRAAAFGERQRVFCASLADWCDAEAPADQHERLFDSSGRRRSSIGLPLRKLAARIAKCLPSGWVRAIRSYGSALR